MTMTTRINRPATQRPTRRAAGFGPRGRSDPRRRAYILIVVLGLTAVVVALGWAFLDAHGTVMPEAVNRRGAARALYLAESGITLGTHFLMYPPTTVPPGGYWGGASGINIDETADYTDVSVVRDEVDRNLFAISAVGVAHDPGGSVRGKHSILVKAIVPPKNKWQIPYAVLGMSMTIPSTVIVDGDIHANGNLSGMGWCQGNVSATGTAVWGGGGPPESVTSSADPFFLPSMDPALFTTYSVNGNDYTAYYYEKFGMTEGDAAALNAIDMSPSNPGRIIVTEPGDFTILANVNLNGMLVVNGDLRIDGANFVLTAVPDFPAILATGHIRFTQDNGVHTITGPVLCAGRIMDEGHTNLNVEFVGSCIARMGFGVTGAGNQFRFTWDAARSTFWNLEVEHRRWPITLLSWKEN
jgi:hypothetical protein